jgi:hypothetical protein
MAPLSLEHDTHIAELRVRLISNTTLLTAFMKHVQFLIQTRDGAS